MPVGCSGASNFLLVVSIFTVALLNAAWVSSGELAVARSEEIAAAAGNATKIEAATTTTTSSATEVARLPPPPRVKLNKCCHYGEYLDVVSRTCVAGSSELWVPIIFLVGRQKYHTPQGTSPKFMTFVENVRPTIMQRSDDATASGIGSGCTMDELQMFTGSGNIILFSNGSLVLREQGLFIDPSHFCVDRESALVCFPPSKSGMQQPRGLKLKKCCGKHSSYNITTRSCYLDATLNRDGQLRLPSLEETAYQTVYGFPKCREASTYVIAGAWREAKIDLNSGQLELHRKNFSVADYCMEEIDDSDFGRNRTAVQVFACLHHYATAAPDNALGGQAVQVAALNFSIVISVVFLGATLVAGHMIPSVHHLLHWRCQIYYVLCLFIGDLLLAYTQLSHSALLGSPGCLWLASAMHFFFLSAFFWLNTMCFNIWWTFRDFRPSSLERNQELLRLRLYSVYAWGIPLVIAVVAACIDRLPETTLLQPGFGVSNCWFSGEHLSIFAYFFAPIGVLLIANIALFISTTHQLTCGLWKRDDVKTTTEKNALLQICLKLVIVMGVTWIMDIISWLIGGPHSIWFVTDLINALQGVFIFIVVGCQPQVWAACKRFCCPRSRQEITNTTNGVQHSSSSQGLPSMAAGTGGEATQNTSINTTIGPPSGSEIANGPLAALTKIPMETVC